MNEQEQHKLPGILGKMSSALRDSKSENTTALVERFTSEMTLVAEGLVEDQGKLRGSMDSLTRDLESLRQRTESAQNAADSELADAIREYDSRLTGIDRQLDAMNKRLEKLEKRAEEQDAKKSGSLFHLGDKNLMQQIILLASIICGSTVLIAILNLFR